MTQRLLVWALIASGIVYAFFIGGTPAGIELPELRVLTAGIVLAAGATWAIAAWRDPSWRPRSVLLPGILACLGSMGVSTLASRAPRVSVEYLVYAVILAALYLLLVRLMTRPFFRDRIVAVGALSGIIIAGLFVLVVVGEWVRLWLLVGRVTAPPLRPGSQALVFGNPAPVLVMTVLLGAVAVGWVAQRWPGRRVAVAAIVVLCAAAVLLTGVRGGWFAAGMATLGAIVLTLLGSEQRSAFVAAIRGWAAGPGKALVVAAVAIGVVAVVVLGPGLMRRVTAGGEDLRETFYRIALQMFGESPVFGVGPGVWVAQRISYTLPVEVDHYVPHAHDLYLQGLAEMGIVGLAAGLVAAAMLAWLLRDALQDEDPARRRWGWVATFATIYFATHQLLDFYANAPTTLIAFAIPIALLDATATRAPARLRERWLGLESRPALAVGAVVLTAALAATIAFEIPALRHAQAVKLANQGLWAEAYPIAQSAAAMDPDMPIYQLTAGLAAGHAGQYAEAARDLRLIAEAGDLPEAWLDLADAEMHLGDNGAAAEALGRALRLGDQRGAVAVPGAELALRLGNAALATRAITRVLLFLPSLAEDPWWRAEPARAAAFDTALSAARASGGPGVAWELALLSGDSDAARAEASELPADVQPGVLDVIAAWTGDSGAVQALEERCRREPLDWPVLWCARVSARFDTAQTKRFREWGRIAGFSDEALGQIRVEPDPTVLAVAGDPAYLYGAQAYRRFTPWDIVAPGLIHLTLQ